MRVFVMFGILSIAGCTGSTGESDTDPADTDTDTDADSDADSDADTDVEDPKGVVEGFVYDITGAAVAGSRVNVCNEMGCRTDASDATGAYHIEGMDAGTYSYYTVAPSGGKYINTLVAFTWTDHEVKTQNVYLLEPQSTTLPAKAAEVGLAGLFLTVGLDNLVAADFTELGDKLYVARVEPAYQQPIDIPGTILAVWWVGPFEATSATGVPVQFANAWELAVGTEYTVFAGGGPTEPGWINCGKVVVSEDGKRLKGNASLPILTSVVLVDEP